MFAAAPPLLDMRSFTGRYVRCQTAVRMVPAHGGNVPAGRQVMLSRYGQIQLRDILDVRASLELLTASTGRRVAAGRFQVSAPPY